MAIQRNLSYPNPSYLAATSLTYAPLLVLMELISRRGSYVELEEPSIGLL